MTDFHNVKVTLHSSDDDYRLEWETAEARYHVWVTRDWFLRRGVGLRAPTLYKKPHNDNPHGRISRLDATKHRMVAEVVHHARSAGLFTAAREKSEWGQARGRTIPFRPTGTPARWASRTPSRSSSARPTTPRGVGSEARGRGRLAQWKGEMTDEKPWRVADLLADLSFTPLANGMERATINGVQVVRQNGRYWIITHNGPQWSDIGEKDVNPALDYLFEEQKR